MITTTRIYLLGAVALAAMIGFGLYRQARYAPVARAQQIGATLPASQPAPAASQRDESDEITRKRSEIAADPNNLDAQAQLAYLLISKTEPNAATIQEATQLIENACRKSQFKERKYIDTLGRVYAVAGQYDRAITVGEIVRLMAENAHDPEALAAADVRLEIYRSLQLKKQIDDDMKKAATQPASQPH